MSLIFLGFFLVEKNSLCGSLEILSWSVNCYIMLIDSQNKLQDLAGQHSDVLENLTPKVRKRVDALRDIQVREFFYLSIEFL